MFDVCSIVLHNCLKTLTPFVDAFVDEKLWHLREFFLEGCRVHSSTILHTEIRLTIELHFSSIHKFRLSLFYPLFTVTDAMHYGICGISH